MPYYINQQCPANYYPYIIQPGDTLYNISLRLEVSLASILEANPGIDPYRLRIGQIICIPACPPFHTAYIIQAGDTLNRIAQIYNVSVDSILEANPGIDPYYLRIGQRICIPIASISNCPELLTAMQADINMLREESEVQRTSDSNYGDSTETTRAAIVSSSQLRFDAVPVTFSGDYRGHYTNGRDYPYYLDAAAGGQRGITVKDNFGVWHSFGYRELITQ